MKDVINGPMTIVAPFTLLTAETMGSQLVHIGSTMLASVGMAQGRTQTEPHRNSHRVVIHSQPQAGNGESMKPSTRLQAPDSLVDTASRCALVMSSGAHSRRDSAVDDTTEVSQVF